MPSRESVAERKPGRARRAPALVDGTALANLAPLLVGQRVAVIGDVCLDEYIVGRPTRLSREAPVPVLEFERRFTLPGAAANPALNVRALGGEAMLFSVVGDDEAGHQLRRQLAEGGVGVDGLVVDPERPTSVKTRVLAEVSLMFPQQVARIDRVVRDSLSTATRAELYRRLSEALAAGVVDAILYSDYKNGAIDAAMAAAGVELAAAHGRIITADSQGDLAKFKGFTVVKANRPDAEQDVGFGLAQPDDFRRAGRTLIRRTGAQAVLITRGSDGISVVDRNSHLHIPAINPGEVIDATGAGDTVIAVLTLALAAGAPIAPAAQLANLAASLVVRKLGNATVEPEELRRAIREWDRTRNPGTWHPGRMG